jgi:hypothetical protein
MVVGRHSPDRCGNVQGLGSKPKRRAKISQAGLPRHKLEILASGLTDLLLFQQTCSKRTPQSVATFSVVLLYTYKYMWPDSVEYPLRSRR